MAGTKEVTLAGIEYDIERGDIAVTSEYREKDLVKQVPGTTYDKDAKRWRAPLSWATCVTFRGVFGPDLVIGPRLQEWAWQQREWIDYVTALRTAHDVPTWLEEGRETDLYPFQRAGVAFLAAAQQALLADPMGLGKTVQLIRTLRYLKEPLPVLIVAPNTVKRVWLEELRKWEPELAERTVIIEGGAAARRKIIQRVADGEVDVAIINWEALRLHTRLAPWGSLKLRACEEHGGTDSVKPAQCEKHPKELNDIEWHTVIADEAHRAKEPKSKQTRALWAVSQNARYRYALTGTPIANHGGEFWSVMHFVSPADFPRKSTFVDRYCLMSWNAFGGMDIVGIRPEKAPELAQFVDPRMIRRPKEVALPHLPPKVYTTRYAEMSAKQTKAYRQMAERMIAELDNDDAVAATNPLARLTRLSQFSCSFAEINDEGNLKLKTPSNKLDALMDILAEAGDEQVVVFAESRQLIELAEKALEKANITYGSIHGQVPVPERQRAVDEFQRGQRRVILATLGAGGEGITLTAARIMVFLQRSWSMVKNLQAEDRIHRPGQDASSVEIIDVVAPGTVEEYRALKLQDKEERLEEIVRDRDTLRAMLDYQGEDE